MKILKTITSLLCAFTLTLTSTPLVKTSATDTQESEGLIYKTSIQCVGIGNYYKFDDVYMNLEYNIRAYRNGHVNIELKCTDNKKVEPIKTESGTIHPSGLSLLLGKVSVIPPDEYKEHKSEGVIKPPNGESGMIRYDMTKYFIDVSKNNYSAYRNDSVAYNKRNGLRKTRAETSTGMSSVLYREELIYSGAQYVQSGELQGVSLLSVDYYMNDRYSFTDLPLELQVYTEEPTILDDGSITYRKASKHKIIIPFSNNLGDINNDNAITVADLVLLQKWLLAVPNTELPNWRAADLCKDNKLDVFDLCLLRRKVVEHNAQ